MQPAKNPAHPELYNFTSYEEGQYKQKYWNLVLWSLCCKKNSFKIPLIPN